MTRTMLGVAGVLLAAGMLAELASDAAAGEAASSSGPPGIRVAGIVLKWIRTDKEANFFVHPAEFLVTSPDGSILERTILGDRLLIDPTEEGTKSDSRRVFLFDLPLKASAAR